MALKTINEKVESHGSSNEDVVEKDVTNLANNFRKFLKFKYSEKFGDKGKFMPEAVHVPDMPEVQASC